MSVSSYARHLNPVATPQTQPLRGQVANSAGGYSFEVDCFERLDRFLILGCEGGSYYATERKLTTENAQCVLDCAKEDTERTINRIVEISTAGRAPKNDPAIFALALLASQSAHSGGKQHEYYTKLTALALAAMPKVCRTGTHLFQFVEVVNQLRGWGRALRTGVANWYTSKDADDLAFQVTKYASRNGWSHRDVLRLTHPKPTGAHKDVFQYIAQKQKWLDSKRAGTRVLVMAEEAKTATVARLKKMIRDEGLVREHIPTERLNEPAIWEALLENMPITAMIRNLNKLTELGLLAPLSSGSNKVVTTLTDAEQLKRGRVHPFNLLVALKTYASGKGFRGDKTWNPVPQVVAALEDAFYLSFDTIQPTGKRHLFGVDVSGSMTWDSSRIANTNVTAREAAACLSMVGLRTEPQSYVMAFSGVLEDIGLRKNDRLDEVIRKTERMRAGSTDCSIPMTHALQHNLQVDAFVVLTDNETYSGSIHPVQALRQYRQRTGINAKLIVVGMVSNPFTIADPTDAGMLDVVGFDSAAPAVMADFVRGESYRKAA
jgi:60 kDa SS-A/Ro ribonucleoprotein